MPMDSIARSMMSSIMNLMKSLDSSSMGTSTADPNSQGYQDGVSGAPPQSDDSDYMTQYNLGQQQAAQNSNPSSMFGNSSSMPSGLSGMGNMSSMLGLGGQSGMDVMPSLASTWQGAVGGSPQRASDIFAYPGEVLPPAQPGSFTDRDRYLASSSSGSSTNPQRMAQRIYVGPPGQDDPPSPRPGEFSDGDRSLTQGPPVVQPQ